MEEVNKTIRISEVENLYVFLNYILEQLLYSTETEPKAIDKINWYAGVNKTLDNKDRYLIFEKLQKDGYLAKTQGAEGSNGSGDRWYITLDGILFFKNKGYLQQQKNFLIKTALSADSINRNKNTIILIFFSLIFLLGIFIYRDYGISFDEQTSRIDNGLINWNFIQTHDAHQLLIGNEKYHGPAFEIILIYLEKLFALKDISSVFFMRHFVTFLAFFISLVFFFFLSSEVFKSWKWGLLSVIFLVLSPRIFADAFYNSKDLVFMSFFIISLYASYYFIKEKNYKWAIILALSTGFLISIRIMGIIILPVVYLFFFVDILVERIKKNQIIRYVLSNILFTCCTIGFTIFFWPVLWLNPLHHFGEAIKEMSHYHWSGSIPYLGRSVSATKLPWHYIPLWIFITTPLWYSLLLLVAIVILVKNLLLDTKTFFTEQKFLLFFLISFITPILSVIFLHSVVYNGWRHVYFIYPSFILLSVYGLMQLCKFKNGRFAKLFAFITLISISLVSCSMIIDHPSQNTYFNLLGRIIFTPVEKNFEMDYWGLSYKQGLEFILKNDTASSVKINGGFPLDLNVFLLSEKDKDRVHLIHSMFDSDYYLTNDVYNSRINIPGSSIFYEMKNSSGKLLTIYKIDHSKLKPTILFEKNEFFDDSNHSCNCHLSDYAFFSAPYSNITDSTARYSYAFVYKIPENIGSKTYAEFQLDAFSSEGSPEGRIIISFEKGENNMIIDWQSEHVAYKITRPQKWYHLLFASDFPSSIKKGDIIKVYLWNTGNNTIYVDDIEFNVKSF
jgi:hypothetical protein